MDFNLAKEKALKKMAFGDKSDKGSVDELIKPLLDKINSFDDYYTTSSCSGRIILIRVPESGRKKEAEFLYRTHKLAKSKKIVSVIKESVNYGCGSVWFRQEPTILHVAARTLKHASAFLRIARVIGFKRSGLFEVKKRFLLELVSTERIETIIVKSDELLVSNNYVGVLVDEANKKLTRTWKKIKSLERALNKLKIIVVPSK